MHTAYKKKLEDLYKEDPRRPKQLVNIIATYYHFFYLTESKNCLSLYNHSILPTVASLFEAQQGKFEWSKLLSYISEIPDCLITPKSLNQHLKLLSMNNLHQNNKTKYKVVLYCFNLK